MATTNLGRVRFNMRGDYNPDADPLYSLLDLVSDGGGSFVYINDTPSNEPTSSTSHWQQIAEKGLKGDTGAKIVTAAWSGNDMLLTLDDESTITLTGAKTTLKGDPGDISNLKVDGATKTKAAGVVDLTSDFARYALWRKTASGNPVSVYPVPESPLYPKVSGTFTQAGTGDPSPSNIRPITPWLASGGAAKVKRTGKNLLNHNTSEMNRYVDSATGVLTNAANNSIYASDYIDVVSGVNYKHDGYGGWASMGDAFYDANKTYISGISGSALGPLNGIITPPANAKYVRITYSIIWMPLPQLELGSTATPYEPYSGTEITLTAPQEIAAGWMNNEAVGVVTGIKTVLNGSETWDDANFETSGYFETTLSVAAHGTPGLACSRFLPAASAVADSNKAVISGTSLKIYPADAVATDKTAWLAYLAANPVTIAYTRATPVSITPTAAPLAALPQVDRVTPRSNVLTASTGQIELTYAKSPIRESDDIATAIAAL